MEKIKKLGWYQKLILILSVIVMIVFTGLYIGKTNKKGMVYQNTILVPREKDGGIIYEGVDNYERVSFFVKDKKVTYQKGNNTYDPYIVEEDASAVPSKYQGLVGIKGVKLYQNDQLLFEGAIIRQGNSSWGNNQQSATGYLVSKDGHIYGLLDVEANEGVETIVVDENGKVVIREDKAMFYFYIINAAMDPVLTSKGNWLMYFVAMLFTILNMVETIFADELFRFNLSFSVKDPESVEPSDFHLFTRNFAMTIILIAVISMFSIGLK